MKTIFILLLTLLSTTAYSQDTDTDGLSDFDEINGTFGYTSDPNLADTDSDGLNDFNEVMGAGNPQNYVSNPNLVDSDTDGLTDLDEVFASFSVYSNPLLEDTDSDGLTDFQEATASIISGYYSNPNVVDSDGDGLTDYEEVMGINANGYTSDPSNVDTDGGTVEDGDEITAGLDPNDDSDDVCFDDTDDPIADVSNLPDVNGVCEVTSLTAPTATDYCSGAITGTHNIVLPITQIGTTVVTWTYEDQSGNKLTQTQDVVITEVTGVATISFVDDVTLIADFSADSYIWINCANLQAVPGQTAQQFTATANGSYALVAVNGGCRDTTDCEIIDKVSLDENISNANISIYPNPSKDGKFSISYNGIINSIKLFDLRGKEIIINTNQFDKKQIDCSHLETGNYIIQMEIPSGVVTKELVITK